jgi:hypothetical protein
MPPIAGRSANARGAECQFEGGGCSSWFFELGLGSRRSSVEDWKFFRISFNEYSEKLELRRRVGPGLVASLLVLNRLVDGRCLNCADSSTV